jgi:hypothetical protein
MMKNRIPMRKITIAALLAASLAQPAPAQTNPLSRSSSVPAVQPDPVPGQGADFAPSEATATTAYMGAARDDLHNDCTAYNPCALPSSAPHPLGQLGDLSK